MTDTSPSRPRGSKVFREMRDRAAGRGRVQHREYYQKLAGIISARRHELGLSQSELAQLCHTTQSAIARMESGQRPPRVDTLLTVADVMDCTVELTFVPRS